MTYEQLLEMLRDMHPDIDFETAEGLIDRKILTSFDVVSIAAELSETYGGTSCPRTSTAPGPSSP